MQVQPAHVIVVKTDAFQPVEHDVPAPVSLPMHQAVGRGVVTEDALRLDSHPDAPAFIAGDVVHGIVDQCVPVAPVCEAADAFRLRRIDIYPQVGSYPDGALLVLIQRGDEVVAQRAFFFGERQEGQAVIAVQPVFGAEPHEAEAVLQDGVDRIVGQAPAAVDGTENILGVVGRGGAHKAGTQQSRQQE